MRDAAKAIIREIGVETGGSNIQFAINPADGRMIVIEMNPRVSAGPAPWRRKATGFPIAKIAAKLAVGYTLDELQRHHLAEGRTTVDRGREERTPARRSSRLLRADHRLRGDEGAAVRVREVPRRRPTLTTQMKSVGETMAIGRTFKESLQKALRGLEVEPVRPRVRPRRPLGHAPTSRPARRSSHKLTTPERRAHLVRPLRLQGRHDASRNPPADPDRPVVPPQHRTSWCDIEDELAAGRPARPASTPELMLRAKQNGFVDRQLANLWGCTEAEVRRVRKELGIEAVFKRWTPAPPSSRRTRRTTTAPTKLRSAESVGVRIRRSSRTQAIRDLIRTPTSAFRLRGRGPPAHRQAADHDPRRRAEPDRPGDRVRLLLRARPRSPCATAGYEVIMVNSNPETVSTDYDTSDHLFFEPLTVEDVLNIYDRMKPEGVIVQFGGQTPLNLAKAAGERTACRSSAPASRASTSAEDRERFAELVDGARAASSRPTAPPATSHGRRARGRAGSASRCWCGRASCSAAGPWRSSTTRTT